MKLSPSVLLLLTLAPAHVAAAVCAAGNPPALPTMISVVPGNASAVITFLPSIGPGPNITYIVRLDIFNTWTGTKSPIVVAPLINGNTYVFDIAAKSDVCTSDFIRTSAVTPTGPPDAPTSVSAIPGNGRAVITFGPPTNNGGLTITRYTVTANPTGITASGVGSPITIPGLVNGTAYTFAVTATNANGTGPPNTSLAVTPAGPPGAPTSVSAIPGNGSALISFIAPASNGGLPITRYTVTSNPGGLTASSSGSPITVTGLVNGTAYTFAVTATNTSGTGPSASSPVVTVGPISIQPGGIVNSASSAAPVAPGSLASIYGTFPVGVATATTMPWPTTLSGLSVQINGTLAPIYFASSTQINIQIPWELAGLTTASVTATVGSQSSSPQTVTLAIFAPGLFTMNAQAQGAIIDALSGQLISSSNPARAGATYLAIYCTGLGPVANEPTTGVAASASQLSGTVQVPTVTIGGVRAGVLFAGLAPTFIGVYQINVQVPAAVSTGNAVPVIVSIGGNTSNTGTVAVVGIQQIGFTGNWMFAAKSTVYGFQSSASGLLTQNGNSISGQLSLSGTPCAVSGAVTGTVSGTALSMTLNEGGQLVTFTGTVSADSTSASGTYAAPPGGCTNGDYGTWFGVRH